MPQPSLIRLLSHKPKADGALAWLVFGSLLTLTVLIYWPALSGGYLFDDAYYVQNPDIWVKSLRLGDWTKAALSQTQAGANQIRALSMLSFAANYYFTGPNPWWFKLTNVGIHLLNGLLLFQVFKQLFRLYAETRVSVESNPPQSLPFRIDLFAAVLSGLWLVLPINLTDVAYVSQRIESLANAFVLLGLLLYLHSRRQQFVTDTSGHLGWIGIVVCMILGILAKESAALLPLYTGCIEFAITGFRNRSGRWSHAAIWTHVFLLLLPLAAGLYWISTWNFANVAHLRTFTIPQRLLTEPRVLVDYLDWTLAPHLNALTFYHDDLQLSRGLLDPPTTLAAIAFLATVFAVAIWQRKPRPLVCLGILWFFAGHAMTGTIIPLELVFEHRNYFPSIGVLLAIGALLTGCNGEIARRALAPVACGAIAFFAFTTFLRAEEWSDPLRLAYAEASKRPDSMRAQYGYAQFLIVLAGNNVNSPLLGKARKVLNSIVFRPDSGLGPPQALIFLNGRAHQPVDPRWWTSIMNKLRKQPPSITDISSIIFLEHCMMRGDCEVQMKEMLDTFIAAMESSGGDANVMSAYSDFAYIQLHDPALAERLSRGVVEGNPHVAVYRANLVQLLTVMGKFDQAQIELDSMKSLNHLGALDVRIGELQTQLDKERKVAPTHANLPTTAPAPRVDSHS